MIYGLHSKMGRKGKVEKNQLQSAKLVQIKKIPMFLFYFKTKCQLFFETPCSLNNNNKNSKQTNNNILLITNPILSILKLDFWD